MAPAFIRRLATALVFAFLGALAAAQDAPLKVAVYDVPPYGHVEPDGSIDGVSVELWRRAAESLGRQYHLVPVAQMEEILKGLERKDYDAAIGAITITPARLARVDFSYPTHRSGAAVAVRQDTGPMAALASYGAVLSELTPLIALTFALLIVMGIAMWLAERPMRGWRISFVTLDSIYSSHHRDRYPKNETSRWWPRRCGRRSTPVRRASSRCCPASPVRPRKSLPSAATLFPGGFWQYRPKCNPVPPGASGCALQAAPPINGPIH